jgi:hypothetical protein
MNFFKAGRETVHAAGSQAGHDVRVADPAKTSGAGGEGEVGVNGVKLHLT